MLKFGKALFIGILIIGLYLGSFDIALAATLSGPSDTLSSTTAQATGVTHNISFTTSTTDSIKQIYLQFSTTSGGNSQPAHLGISASTLGTVTGIGSGWNLDKMYDASGILVVNAASSNLVTSGTSVTIPIDNITNSAIADCQPTNHSLEDTCWVHITTYSDDGSTEIDSADTTYTVYENPSLSFAISGISSGVIHNGITTTGSSTDSSLAFGLIKPGEVAYVAQKLDITTNAPNGYSVYAYLSSPMIGSKGFGQISPFGATDATWTSPQDWMTPTGNVPNSNTGWLGANTSDDRITGWASSQGKFAPFSTTHHVVAYSNGPDLTTKTIYVTFALGVNTAQAADVYQASIIYQIQPLY